MALDMNRLTDDPRALVLEEKGRLALREFPIGDTVGSVANSSVMATRA